MYVRRLWNQRLPQHCDSACRRTCLQPHALPWARQRQKSALERFAAKFFTPNNMLLAVLWLAWLGLVVYVQSHAAESIAFDPFHILQARRSRAPSCAGPREVAWRCAAAAHLVTVSAAGGGAAALKAGRACRWTAAPARRTSGAHIASSRWSTTRCGGGAHARQAQLMALCGVRGRC